MIEGKKVKLRLVKNEEDLFYAFNAYNEVSERADTDHTEIHQVHNRIKKFNENGLWSDKEGLLLITTKDSTVIGLISFTKTTDFELAIGYRLFKEIHRQEGYMSEALKLFSAYLFETVPHITRLDIKTAVNNTGSRRLAEKCGYKQEGILRKAYFYRGEICDFVIYSMLREESPKLKDLLK